MNNLDPSGHDSQPPLPPPKQVYHPPQTQQDQQHNAAPPPASVGNSDNTTWLAELQGKLAGTPIASLIAPSQASAGGGEVGKYLESGTAALIQHPSALGTGSLQGLANTLNTVENAVDSVVNSAVAGNNLLNMGANKIAGLVDHGAAPFGMVPSIPISNWSKGAVVSHDPAHPVEKAVTGTAIAVATTFGGGAAEDAAPALAAASDAAKGLMGKVSAIAEAVGGWIKGLLGRTSEKEGTSVTEGMGAPKHWNEPTTISNRRIYQRNDLFDPKRTDATGNTNLQRMQRGQPPIGNDGRPVTLHHLIQQEPGPMAEVGGKFHSENTKALHGLVEDKSSFRYSRTGKMTEAEKSFKRWSYNYWKRRAAGIGQ